MDDRLADLLSMLRERFAADANVEEVEAFLSYEGYDRRQIGEILSLLFSEIPIRTTGSPSVVHNHMTFRVMGPHEHGRARARHRAGAGPDRWAHRARRSARVDGRCGVRSHRPVARSRYGSLSA